MHTKPHTFYALIFSCLLTFLQGVHADELPPGLESAIRNPEIPMIVDATIVKFNEEGHASIKINKVYKPAKKSKKSAPLPPMVRGYASSGNEDKIVPLRIITDKGKKRFLFFLKGDLLYFTYNNRFEIRESKNRKLEVYTNREWKPLEEMIKLIPKKK